MRKKVFGRKLSRNRRSRTALFRSLVRAMILEGKVKTTKAKARAVVGDLDRMIGLVADGSVSARRSALAILANDKEATEVLFKKYLALAKDRKSGFTNLVQVPPRRGDAAEMMQISWVKIAQDDVKTVKKASASKTKES